MKEGPELCGPVNVSTSYYFPDHPDEKLPIGQEIMVLIDFSNNDEVAVDVSGIGAWLHSPYDLKYHIQSFTMRSLSAHAQGGSQVSLEYKFKTDAGLEPLSFWISGVVEYTCKEEVFRTVWVNSTIDFVEDSKAPEMAT